MQPSWQCLTILKSIFIHKIHSHLSQLGIVILSGKRNLSLQTIFKLKYITITVIFLLNTKRNVSNLMLRSVRLGVKEEVSILSSL